MGCKELLDLKFYNLVTMSMQRFNATWPSILNMLTRCDATLMIGIENRTTTTTTHVWP